MINYILNYHSHTEKSRRTGILGNFLSHMCIKSFRINTLKLFQNDVIQRKIIYGLSILIYQFLFHSLAFKREKIQRVCSPVCTELLFFMQHFSFLK